MARRRATPEEVARHDKITRDRVFCAISQVFEDYNPYVRELQLATTEVMKILKTRGYEPQIRTCNQLKDGTWL
jgi:hypothetical protein